MTELEKKKVKDLIGRELTEEEVMIFSALWSEHTSYKSSKIHLKKLPTKTENIVVGPGENAGVIKISTGTLIAFKIESHNHPSYIEPYSGAATGVGGIIRDVLSMGARPIAIFDALLFGDPKDDPRMKYIIQKVVEGISDYGNSVGIPVVGGYTHFSEFFQGNILVNVMCIGIVEKLVLSVPKRKGKVIYVGAKTGKDGIMGATMASQSFYGDVSRKKPAVQIGDPFAEKCLISAVLSAVEEADIIAMQDMGAAGLLNSTSEVAAKGNFGIRIDVSKVPKREKLKPIECLLSESQERMLIISDDEKIKKIFEMWGLHAEEIGELTDTGRYEVFDGEKKVFDIPISAFTPPQYDRKAEEPIWIKTIQNFRFDILPLKNPEETFIKMIKNINIAYKSPIWTQYDWSVMTNTIFEPRFDSALLRIKREKGDEGEEETIISATVDANPFWCLVDPFIGSQLVVLESFRNITCGISDPIAITDNLNFGSPENPEVMWQFIKTIDGIKKACESLGIGVASGNVSFYNDKDGKPIPPTPTIGMIGEMKREYFEMVKEGKRKILNSDFTSTGYIVAIGEIFPQISASYYLYIVHNKVVGSLKEPNYNMEKRIANFIKTAAIYGVIDSIHDVSEGGIIINIFECLALTPFGARIKRQLIKGERWDFYLFAECYPLYISLVKDLDNFIKLATKYEVPFQVLGEVVDENIFEVEEVFSLNADEIKKIWKTQNEKLFF